MQGIRVEIADEDLEGLRKIAVHDRRSVREQGGFLLHLKIVEVVAELDAELKRELDPA